MAFNYITEYDCPNFGYPKGRRAQNKVTEIVIHHWGKDGGNFDSLVRWFCTNNDKTSAHFVVEAGRAACIVNWNDAAWHAGNKWHNMHSIGIECRPECTDGDFRTVAEVVAMLYKEYGVLPLIGHKDVAATACPGRYYTRLGELKKMAEDILAGEKQTAPIKPSPTPKPKPAPAPELIDEDGVWGTKTTKRTQQYFKTTADGIVSNQLTKCKKYLPGAHTSSWKFGWHTKNNSPMVTALQKFVEAKADGWAGYETAIKLQEFLKKKGLYDGRTDGLAGYKTMLGWQKFLNRV